MGTMVFTIRPRSQFSKEIQLKKYFNHELADTTGACLSVACAVHCLAMPLLVAVLPLIGLGFLANESAELVLILVAIGLAVGSLAWGGSTSPTLASIVDTDSGIGIHRHRSNSR